MRHAIQFYYVLVIASFLHVNHSSIPVEASIADAHAHVHTNRHTSFKTSSTKMTAFIQQQTHNYNNAKNNNNYNYHHHHYHYYYYNHLHPKTRTKLHLNFNNYESTNNENKQTITRAVTLQTLKRTISNDLIQQLETRRDASSIILPFTHTFQVKRLHSTTTTTTKQSSKGEYLCIRPLMKKDLPDAVRMCVREFGSYANKSNTQIRSDTSSSSSSKSNLDTFDLNTSIMNKSKQIKLPSKIQTIMDDFFTMYENFVFAFVVQLGLDQRIERQQLGDDPTKSNIVPDHNVLCLISLNDQQQEQELIGITEISIQPLNPTRTAPPFVLPLFIKQIISQLDSDASLPIAYVSNVLIKESYRGMGYAKLLMAAVEGRAKEMGYDELFLHVDANTAGTNAQNLYWGLGYQSYDKYKDNPSQSPFAWMGDEFVNKNKGLYLVDGAPLLYLTKKINND